MEKLTLLILSVICLSWTSPQEERGLFLTHQRVKSVKDETLSKKEAVYKFIFVPALNDKKRNHVMYSIDGIEYDVPLIDNSYIVVRTTPGKHDFQFYYDEDHFEMSIDSLEILPQYRDDYELYFESSEFPVVVDKPILYLYPTKRQEVQVSLDAKGRNLFAYPDFNNLRHDLLTWKTTANPDGTIELKGKEYNYLFWESEQTVSLSEEDRKSGFVVSGKETTAFLENTLTEIGFNSKERADFITYWAPRMQHNSFNFIHFYFNDECDNYAKYIIEPKPDQHYRVYMTWGPADRHIKLSPQELPSIDRSGFEIVEWGGFEIPKINLQ